MLVSKLNMLDQKFSGIKRKLLRKTTSFFSDLFSQTRSSKSETIGLELNFRKDALWIKLCQGSNNDSFTLI
jgi:hypothetical protein